MFNIKWSGIAAGTAFALALALSLILGQTNLPIALLRAVIFAALFFGLGTAAWALINTFIPELLSTETVDIATHLFSTGTAGSRVNITVGDAKNAALPEQNGASDDVGDFNELFTPKNTDIGDGQDIDQISTTGYTEKGEAGEFSSDVEEFSAEKGGFSSAFSDVGLDDEGEGEAEEDGEGEAGEFSMDFSAFVPGGLDGGGGDGEAEESDADMDSFSFFPEAGAGAGGSASYDEPAPERKVSRNKPMKLEGDFDAKEIAAGLRTVLEKDKK